MASLFWSWIFILQLIRPGLAQVNFSHEIFAERAVAATKKSQKSRNMFIALAVACTVVLIAVIIGVVVLLLRKKNKSTDTESAPLADTKQAEKPEWFMVDSKKDWWSIYRNLRPATAKEQEENPDGSRIERLKAALNKKAGRSGKPLLPVHNDDSPTDLPIQSIPKDGPRYPDVLERGYRAPIYTTQSPPQVPSIPIITRTEYVGDKVHPRSPPKALVTQGLTRTFARHDRRGLPRSPATRRKSWLKRNQRHPFIPLADSETLVSVPKTAAVDEPVRFNLTQPRAAPKPPAITPVLAPVAPSKPAIKRVPPPLLLEENIERKVRFGFATSPLTALLSSPRLRRRGESPAF